MKTGTKILVLILVLNFRANAQDVIYSQFYANPLYLNPALAGSKLCNRLTVNYRNQWPEANKGYVSYSATWDQQFDKLSGGLGAIVNTDIGGGGIFNKFSASGIYSYRLMVSRYIIMNAALKAGYMQYRLDWNKLLFGDQINAYTGAIDPTQETVPDKLNIGNVDFGAGILGGYKESFYIGVAADHVTRPDISLYGAGTNHLYMRWTFHSGILIDFFQGMQGEDLRNFSISPNIVYVQQGKFRQFNAGMYVNMLPFVGGLWFRNNFDTPDAVIVLLGIQRKGYKIGYSYDYTVSKLGSKTGGAHEISIAITFQNHIDPDRYHRLGDPGF